MARLVGINHVALEVGSLDEALEFWERVFGPLTLRGRSGGMAFIDMGDQFVALATAPTDPPGALRHVGMVVDDRDAVLEAARAAGGDVRGNDIHDPWHNVLQVVDYRDVQFTKAPEVLRAMGAEGLRKSERAVAELTAKGIAPPQEG